jgi:hypothetical protein
MPTVRIYRDGSPVREYAKVSADDDERLARIYKSLSRLRLLHPHQDWTVKVDCERRILRIAPPRVGGYRGSTSHLELKV